MIGEAYAQLITDSDRKLKTQNQKTQKSNSKAANKPSKSPFKSFNNYKSLFSKKLSASSDRDFGRPIVAPKYSAGSPFRKSKPRSNPAPRYSKSQVWSKQDLAIGPRYSNTKTFRSSNITVSPRYSRHQVWSKKDVAVSPRYSTNERVTSASKVTPRYSIPNVWSKDDLFTSPRYSLGNPYKGEKYTPAPRYSSKQIWSKGDLTKSPRYSPANPFKGEKYEIAPRYSVSQIWSKEDLSVAPRYSLGNPYDGYKYQNLPPRYSENKHRFELNKRQRKENAIMEFETPYFTGNYKARWKNHADMHPSFNHHKANSSSDIVRESMREWNIFWVRLNGNKQDSEGVKEKVPKPKFDRKEAEIWND